jgi:hypothetical protein
LRLLHHKDCVFLRLGSRKSTISLQRDPYSIPFAWRVIADRLDTALPRSLPGGLAEPALIPPHYFTFCHNDFGTCVTDRPQWWAAMVARVLHWR